MRSVMVDRGIRTVGRAQPSGPGVPLSLISAGICGTDLKFAQAGVSAFVYGHEFAGTTGDAHANLGVFSDGGMAERVVVPEYALLPLPAGLAVAEARLIEPGAVGWHAAQAVSPAARRPEGRWSSWHGFRSGRSPSLPRHNPWLRSAGLIRAAVGAQPIQRSRTCR